MNEEVRIGVHRDIVEACAIERAAGDDCRRMARVAADLIEPICVVSVAGAGIGGAERRAKAAKFTRSEE